MKKIGILTFQNACNYGAVLQAYALKQVCDDLGYEAHVVDYRGTSQGNAPAPIRQYNNGEHSFRRLVKCARGLTSYRGDTIQWNKFRNFRYKYLNLSVPCSDIQDIVDTGYDAFIAGSDQIWNNWITGGSFDPAYFLQFDTDARKIIYAASSQTPPFEKEVEKDFSSKLKELDFPVSIRERQLAEYAERLSGKKYPVVLDPVLLAGREVIDRILTPETDKKPYILIYQIDSNPYTDISVKALEKRFHCPVYTMTVPRIGSVHGRRGEAGPEEFLSLLKGAKFLVTNSFHGVALSLLYEKKFYVYSNGGFMSRIDGLLSLCGLMDRKINFVRDIDESKEIRYNKVRTILADQRQYSMSFLENALQGRVVGAQPEKQEEKNIIHVGQLEKQNCCGCSACMHICPVGAIVMNPDEKGFLYPAVDKLLCITCGRCIQTCGFQAYTDEERPIEFMTACGAKFHDLKQRTSSRSGGAFVAFSNVILRDDGSVYGAVQTAPSSVRHERAVIPEQRDWMKKAKYVQSDCVKAYQQVIGDLSAGREVLFSGTPCQVSGLRSLLKEMNISDKGLYCCDLVCHGTPSPLFWKKYIEMLEKQKGKKVVEAQFRDKEFGWDTHIESFRYAGEDRKVLKNDFTNLFYQHLLFRPSCYRCPFSNLHRPGDITLGDFWGIEKLSDAFNDNKGVSLLLMNTEKGRQLLRQAEGELQLLHCNVMECLQPNLIRPSAISAGYDSFWEDYKDMNFSDLLRKYTTPRSVKGKAKKMVKIVLYKTGLRKHP